MRKTLLAASAAALLAGTAFASSHREAPSITATPKATVTATATVVFSGRIRS